LKGEQSVKMNPMKQSNITRRQFIKLSSSTVSAMAFMSLLSFPLPAQSKKLVFPELSCGNEKALSNNILIAYASKCGSTGGVAETIGHVLCEKGADVDICLAKNVENLTSYRAVIVGSAVRFGKWLPEAVEFVETYRKVLAQIPVAYFLTCLSLQNPTKENQSKALSYLTPVLDAFPEVKPVDRGLFAGALNYSTISWIFRPVLKLKGAPEGDFRDWNAIRFWAAGLHPILS
jgi:menaquinone-dependent protoporphyrinogen oxidase